MAFTAEDSSLTFRYGSETLRIETWGPDALRVRSTHEAALPSDDWALDEAPPALATKPVVQHDKTGTLTRNQMTVTNIWSGEKMYSAFQASSFHVFP